MQARHIGGLERPFSGLYALLESAHLLNELTAQGAPREPGHATGVPGGLIASRKVRRRDLDRAPIGTPFQETISTPRTKVGWLNPSEKWEILAYNNLLRRSRLTPESKLKRLAPALDRIRMIACLL